jgi:hypothetical protein
MLVVAPTGRKSKAVGRKHGSSLKHEGVAATETFDGLSKIAALLQIDDATMRGTVSERGLHVKPGKLRRPVEALTDGKRASLTLGDSAFVFVSGDKQAEKNQ